LQLYGNRKEVKDGMEYVIDSTNLKFQTVSENFAMIDDGWSESVVIEVDEATNFIDLLRHSESAADRRYARKHLQRFTINISKNIVEEWKGLGKVREIEDILVLTKEYSGLSYTNRFGLVVDLV
jgi:hypothetical protein